MDFDEVADEVYAADLGDFVKVRTQCEKEARSAGDRELAQRIKGLEKPRTSAWVLNALVRRHREEVEPLLALGEGLREAQRALQGDALKELSRQRHQLVHAVARQATALGRAEGVSVSEDVTRQVEETLEAALADPDAAAALLQGRLTSPLSYAGLGGIELGGAPGPLTLVPDKPAAPGSAAQDDAARERELDSARRRVEEARAAADEAQAAAEKAEAAAERTAAEREKIRDRIASLRQELDRLERRRSELDRDAAARRSEAEQAERALRAARRRLADSEQALERLDQ